MAHVGDKVVARARHSRCSLGRAELSHVEVFDREIDDCRVLFAAVLSVPHEAFHVHGDVGRQAEKGCKGCEGCDVKHVQ